jgi:hypothetical protein
MKSKKIYFDGLTKIEDTYNEKENLIEKIVYRIDGKTIYYINKYDESNKLITKRIYRLHDINEIKFDDRGNKIESIYYNFDGIVVRIDEFDNHDNVIKTTYYNLDGTIDHVKDYEDEDYEGDEGYYFVDYDNDYDDTDDE